MSQPASFFEYLGITAAEWENLKTQVPQAEDPLYWLLKKGQVPADSYFAWAQAEYGFAYLQSDYFQSDAAAEARSKFAVGSQTPRNKIPVAEWDGVIFYAGVTPPADLGQNCRFVLAHPKALEEFCLTEPVQQTVVQKVEAKKSAEPQVTTSGPKVTAPEPPPAFPEFDSEDIRIDASEVPDVPQGLEGFALPKEEKTETKVSLDDAPAGLVSEDEIPTQVGVPAADTDAPEGFVINWDKPKTEQSEVIQFQQNSPALESEEPTGSVVIKLDEAKPAAATPAKSSAGQKLSEFEGKFAAVKKQFSTAILFQLETESFTPVQWSDSLKASKVSGPKNLKDPSAFRIVFRTKQPYLGHFVSTEVNDEFVKDWFAQAPKKILLQPVVQQGHVVGAFLAVCEGDTASHLLLSKAEDLAKQIGDEWPQSVEQAA